MKCALAVSVMLSSSIASVAGTAVLGPFLFVRRAAVDWPGGIQWFENESNGVAIRGSTSGGGIGLQGIADPNGLALSAPDRVQIADGSQRAGGILVSDASGIAHWETPNRAVLLQPGMISAYGGPVAPAGWLICDGSEVSRAQYAALFQSIGTVFGSGDGATTFNLPDLRGRSLRGVDDGAGRDPDAAQRGASNPGGNIGDNVGSLQMDGFQGHFHSFVGNFIPYSGGGGSDLHATATSTEPRVPVYQDNITEPKTDHINGMPRPTAETRPQNVYVHFIVKT